MTAALALFVASFVFVFLLSMQQMNVTARRYGLAFFTAVAICGAQLVQYKVLPGQTGVLDLVAFMLGSALGVITGMRVHPWLERVTDINAQWPSHVQNWLGAFDREEHAHELATSALGREIAREAARSNVEVYCQPQRRDGHTWYDTWDLRAGDGSEGEAGMFEAKAVAKALQYLEGCELLVRHTMVPQLVRFQA